MINNTVDIRGNERLGIYSALDPEEMEHSEA